MAAILLKDITIDGSLKDILIQGSRISKIGEAGDSVGWEIYGDIETMDCSGMVAIPGFVNMHTHAGMSLMRGVGEDVEFQQWLSRIWDIESGIDEEYVYCATKVAALEMIKTGTTTFNDQYWFLPQARKAAVEMGINPVLSYVLCDRGDKTQVEFQKQECMRMYSESLSWPEKSQFTVGVHAIYSVCEPLIIWAAEFARKHSLKLHIHLSETRKEVEDCKKAHGGLTPVQYLDSLGFLGPDVIAAHCLWLSDEDVEILGQRKVNCVHNINSNLKLTSGYRFRYNELRDAGANVCLGTDGCASSNNLDMLETMKTSAMVQKAWREDPCAMPVDELVAMATLNPAKALGQRIGRIGSGFRADILIIDTDNYHFLSPGSFNANLIYSAHSDCIDSVICNGRFVMRNRVVPNEEEVIRMAKEKVNTIKCKYN